MIVAVQLLLFGVIAHWEPVSRDGWLFVLRARGNSLAERFISLFPHYSWSYRRMNPRIGELFADALYIVPIHTIVTPLVMLLLLMLMLSLARGRLPERSWRDASLLLLTAALVWWIVPHMNSALFYRAVTANYLYGLVLQLLLFVPLRVAPWRGSMRLNGTAAAAAMLFLGILAGLANEHTGPAAMLAYVALAWGSRGPRHRVSRGIVAGAVGLATGYALLIFASGQSHRYGGLGRKQGLLATVWNRGWPGTLDIFGQFLATAWPLLVALLLATGLALARRETARRWVGEVLFVIAAAAAILVTSLSSPIQGERLHLASVVLLIIAVLIPVARIVTGRVSQAAVFAVAAALTLACWADFAAACHERMLEARERWSLLAEAAPGSMVTVPAFTGERAARFGFVDGLCSELTQRRVATYFGIRDVEVEGCSNSAR